ncbi:MAG: GGDEF and EAL domain-containing protein, partial [Pseudomonadota bacterium]|nr:GGDEF and EAL domain-containing protein [Pseudomonadota bacterium]
MVTTSSLADLLSAAGDAAYDWDMQNDHIRWFGAWEKLFGSLGAPVNSNAFHNAIHPDDRGLVFGSDEHVFDRQYRMQSADGSVIWVHERGSAEIDHGHISRQRGLLHRIEKPADRAAQQELNGRDVLTGCFNRSYMLAQIVKSLEIVKTSRRACAYLVVGVDKMSFINEALGMETGDALLRGVAARLAEKMPARALLSRVGGDMFGILLPEPLGSDFRPLADRLLQSFRDDPVVTSMTPLPITISVGGVRFPPFAKTAAEVMIFAEQALHEARLRGRNLLVEYMDSPERTHENRQLLELSLRIKDAFRNNRFFLAYQPVIESTTGQTLFYEALVRMRGDDGQLIPAAQFVPAIEQLGLAFDLDRYVLDLAVKEMEAAPDLCLAINVSGLTAAQADWPDHVQRVLETRLSLAERLIIEITETAAIVDVSETRRFVDQLRVLGGKVALDDFGAGFTSIRHLRSLSLSIMKIDKDLLHNLLTQPEQQHLVRMLIELARGLGLKTVAEGVETEEVAAWLRRERVDMMQGYFFGKPSFEKPWLEKSAKVAPKPADYFGCPSTADPT